MTTANRLRRSPAPDLSDKLRRACWQSVWAVLYRPSPAPVHFWRRGLLRAFGARIGKGVHVYPSAKIWAPWNLSMADDSCFAEEVDCYNVAQVDIGEGAIVSQKSYLCTASHDYQSISFELLSAPITIGPLAWIASDTFVGPGRTVGRGAVVGARSVVINDIPDWVVAAGHPAREIGRRIPR